MKPTFWTQLVLMILIISMAMSIPVASSAETPAIRYECEADGNSFTNVDSGYPVADASGGKVVAMVGDNGTRYFTMNNIVVDKAGTYTVTVGYASGGVRNCRIGINGQEGDVYTFPSTDSFEAIGTIEITLALAAGSNTLKFYTLPDEGWAPNLDYIEITEGSTVKPTPTPSEGAIGALMGNYTKNGSKITLLAQNGTMTLNFCKDNMVRVRITPSGTAFLADNPDLQAVQKFDSDYDPVDLTVTDLDTVIRIVSADLTLEVDKSTLAISYLDNSGNIITQNDTVDPTGFDGQGKYVRFVRDASGAKEHFFGLGSAGTAMMSTDWRDRTYYLWLVDKGVHAITPLYYSTAGYGVYLNNSNKGTMSFSADYNIRVDGGELDYYFIYGPSFTSIQSDFGELCGTIAMPPKYSLGLTYRGASSFTDQQLIDAITTFHENGIAVDIVGVEPGWQTATYPCTYVWSNKFPNPSAFIDSIHKLGVKVNLWEHPYVNTASPIYNSILPYSLTSSALGVKGTNQQYGFGGIVPDFTKKEARDIYWNIHKQNLASIGVDGFKVDETDSWGCSDSLDITFPGGITANAYHNLLGTLTINNLADHYRSEYNKRMFNYSRGNYTGMQRYATSAYSDTYGYKQYLMTVIAQSYSGTYFTPEVRGASTSNDVDYMRRVQMMFLTPFAMNNEWIDGQSVLDRSDSVIENYKKYNHLYYALIPYKYSLFWQQHTDGISTIRALPMAFQDDPNTYSVDDQYMLGDYMMVCPVSSSAQTATRKVYLPAGSDWVDYETGYVYKGGQTIQYTASADVLPLFIRKGAIIPTGAVGTSTTNNTDTTVTYELYPDTTAATFTLYEDDGESYDYERGEYATTELHLQKEDDTITFTAADRTGDYAVADRNAVVKLHYRTAPTKVTLNNTQLTRVDSMDAFENATDAVWYYDNNANDAKKAVYVKYTDNGAAQTVAVTADEEPEQEAPGGITSNATRYECEAETTHRVGATVTAVAGASGDKVVNTVGNEGRNYFTMNGITVEQDGFYPVDIAYGSGEPRQCLVSINGGEPIRLYFGNTGSFTSMGSLFVKLPLQKGENSLKFYTLPGEGWAPDLDYIDLYPAQSADNRKMVYYTPDSSNTVGATLKNNSYAHSGTVATDFIDETCKVTFANVTSEKSQPKELIVSYANTDESTKKLTLTVNGQSQTLILAPTYSPQLFNTVTVTVYVEPGDNVVQLLGVRGESDGLSLEYIALTADQPSLPPEPSDPSEPSDPGTPDVVVNYGDLNKDDKEDATDALWALQVSVNKRTLDEEAAKAADVNGDDKIDAADALLILKKSVNKIDKYPVEA